ncbi:kinectin-like [Erpetoichthys calabaricus]|uniref:kinectin-like n=1 Tax=Erpetoichthys calabaricus TaxID=27687 RepID=UPI002234B8F7|nr:kinectin-like [Erpetoichthys calabaricus]
MPCVNRASPEVEEEGSTSRQSGRHQKPIRGSDQAILMALDYRKDFLESIKLGEALKDERDKVLSKLKIVRSECKKLTKENENLKQEIGFLECELKEKDEINTFISLEQAELEYKTKQLSQQEDMISELQKSGSHNVSEWNELCIERDNLLQTQRNLKEELENTKNIASDELESLKVKFEEQKAILLQLKDDYAHTVNESDHLQNILQGAVAERHVLQSKVEALTLQIKQVADELQLITTERDQLLRQINESSERPEFEKMQQQISLLTFEKNDLCRNLDQVQAELAQLIKSTKEESPEI